MNDFANRSWKGSPRGTDIERRERSRDGEKFDDSHLTPRYNRTVFNYPLPDGRVLYQQCRYDFMTELLKPGVDEPRKKFLVRRPVGNDGEYVFGTGRRRIIYNYSRVIAAGPGSLVYVTEGETNADALIKANLLATCAISNHWTDEQAATLIGCDGLVFEDNDEHGRENAARAVAALAKYAKSIRVITAAHLWKRLPPEHATKLRDICLEVVPTDGGPITVEPYVFPAERDIAAYEWLYGRHVLRGEVSGTAAMGGTGKSNSAIVEALAMATGKQLLHDRVSHRPLRVVLVNLEDNRNTMDKRITAAMRHYGLTKADVGGRLFVIAKGELKIQMARETMGRIERNAQDIKRLTELMIEKKADVLSVDSLIRTHSVNENSNSSMTEVITCYEDVALKANCAVHLWHHTRKGNGEGATVELARGAQAFIDACRSIRILETMTKKERDDLLIAMPDIGEAGWYFRAFNGKRNFAPPAADSIWFRYVSIELDNEASFEEGGDQVGVVTPWQYPKLDVSAARKPAGREKALAAIAAGGPWRADTRSKTEPWVGTPIAAAFDWNLADKRVRDEVTKLIREWIGAGLLRQVEGLDPKRKPKEYVERA